ncbi:Alpha/Beta hydrolase protein [Daedaleopsis nitida]|nr:Alpha/Beta hydrolase protein [Daedaleopsis nitida]
MKMELDSELATALRSSGLLAEPQAPPEGSSLAEHARNQAKAVVSPLGNFYKERLASDPQGVVVDKRIAIDDASIVVRVLRPSVKDTTYPVLVWFHGGGFLLGDLDMDDYHLRTLSIELQLAIVNVEYRLAPEHQFPVQFNDCYAAVKWVADNAAELDVSLVKGFVVGGDSVGANVAAAVALQARDDTFFKGRKLTGQYLREPAVIHPHAYPERYRSELRSFDESMDVPLLNSQRFLDSLTNLGAPPTDLRISPLLASEHAGLPPAFIQVMHYDPLRDDGILYEKVLREAGVTTRLIRNPGTLHGFYYTFPAIAVAQKVDRDAREGLKWLLSLPTAV